MCEVLGDVPANHDVVSTLNGEVAARPVLSKDLSVTTELLSF